MYNYIWVQRKKYYYHSTYNNYYLAVRVARVYRKKNKSRYFIHKRNSLYDLYLDKVARLYH